MFTGFFRVLPSFVGFAGSCWVFSGERRSARARGERRGVVLVAAAAATTCRGVVGRTSVSFGVAVASDLFGRRPHRLRPGGPLPRVRVCVECVGSVVWCIGEFEWWSVVFASRNDTSADRWTPPLVVGRRALDGRGTAPPFALRFW